VIRTSGGYEDSVREAIGTSLSNGWHVVADTSNDPADEMPALVMHGYTSLVIETLEQLCSADGALPTHVFLQGGVGGLAAAVVSYLWEELGANQAPIFIIVEPSQADCLHQSALNGRPTPAKGDLNTLMAGLSCGEVSRVAWPILEAGVEFFMTVHVPVSQGFPSQQCRELHSPPRHRSGTRIRISVGERADSVGTLFHRLVYALADDRAPSRACVRTCAPVPEIPLLLMLSE
jgi:diaminopropionate ammonia-lyase family